MPSEQEELSDIGVEFQVLYNIAPGRACLKLVSHTRAAAERGVKYQIGSGQGEKGPTISPPMNIEEIRGKELSADLLHGESLYLRITDKNDEHLAMSKVDATRWPANAKGATTVATAYWLYVPKDRVEQKSQ